MDARESSGSCSLASVPRNNLATIHSLSAEVPGAVSHPRARRRPSDRCAAAKRMTRSRGWGAEAARIVTVLVVGLIRMGMNHGHGR
jgi:hypothetical protein